MPENPFYKVPDFPIPRHDTPYFDTLPYTIIKVGAKLVARLIEGWTGPNEVMSNNNYPAGSPPPLIASADTIKELYKMLKDKGYPVP